MEQILNLLSSVKTFDEKFLVITTIELSDPTTKESSKIRNFA